MNNIDLENLLDLGSWLFGTFGVISFLPCFLLAAFLIRKNRTSSIKKRIWKNVLSLMIFFFPFICFAGIFAGRYYFIHGEKKSGLFLAYFPFLYLILIGALYLIYYSFISSRTISFKSHNPSLKTPLTQYKKRRRRKMKIIF